MAAELLAEDLACRRGERIVFSGVSFRLASGGALVVTGANGSGKTSLLRLLASLIAPAHGRLCWDGKPVAEDLARYRAGLHFVGFEDAVKPALSPREMLQFWVALRGVGRRSAAAAIDDALAAAGLSAVAEWPCRWLSAGQRRRLALARLLSAPGLLWLLDEPTSALDAEGRAWLERIIAGHRAQGGQVALSTHHALGLSDAASLSLDQCGPQPARLAPDASGW
jgi:heme exporter protein A